MRLKTLLMALALVLGAGRAESEAMDLQDPRSRWVSVRIERSPAEEPGRLDSEYSAPIPAWFEPGASGAKARVIIFRELVEERLFADERPVPESFSDFVWEFDVETGHVTSASLSGVLSRQVRWGFLHASTEVQIRIDMSTVSPAGYRKPRSVFGHSHNPLCHAVDGYDDCTIVNPREFDRATGYVNAVGELEVDSLVSRLRTFSPLGEAVFSELTNVTELTEFTGSGEPGESGARARSSQKIAGHSSAQALAAHRSLPAVGAAPFSVSASALAPEPGAPPSGSTPPAVR